MKDKHQCPQCHTKAMTRLINLDRWWCTACDGEVDVDTTIKQWATHGYQGKESNDGLHKI